MKHYAGFLAVGFVLFFALPAAAQTCLGGPSFLAGGTQLTFTGLFQEDAQGFRAGIAAGRVGFGGFHATVVHFESLDANTKLIGGFGGADLAIGPARRAFICPIAGVAASFGPDVDPFETKGYQFGGGAHVGVIALDTAGLAIVPTAGAEFNYVHQSIEAPGFSDSGSDTFGIARLGIGLVFSERYALIPAVVIPFEGPVSNATAFNLTFAVHY